MEKDEESLEIRVVLKGSHKGKFKKIQQYLFDTAGISDSASVLRHLVTTFQVPPPRFEHVNVYHDHVTVRDNLLKKDTDVFLKADGSVYCQLCGLSSCPHIDYALDLPEVKKAIEERGWKRKRT